MDALIRKIGKNVKKKKLATAGREIKTLEKADKKRDKLVEKGKMAKKKGC